MSKRQSNFELLRIIAMLMVITLHFFFKSYITDTCFEEVSAKNTFLWLFPAFSMCAVNVYVLISGYFLAGTDFKFERLQKLFVQILEYSLIIAVIMLGTGVSQLSNMHLYEWCELIFPIGTESYWFMTSYFVMFLLSPFLVAGAKSLNKKQFRNVIIALLILMVVEKTIIPLAVLPIDNKGYDFGWFIVLFLIATYIRMYGLEVFEKNKALPWITYIISALAIWATAVGFGKCYVDTNKTVFLGMCEKATDYNYVFCLTAALGLFFGFKQIKLNEEGKLAKLCCKIGPMTLGVYLLHEHFLVRYRWPVLVGANKDSSLLRIVLSWIISVIVIFVLGIAVEWLRLTIHVFLKKKNPA